MSARVRLSAVAVSASRGTSRCWSSKRQQQAIIGAEVMPPFGHAMRLVDRDQRQHFLVDQLAESLGRRPLGRDIEQVEIAVAEPLDRLLRGFASARGQRRRLDAIALGRSDLVVHQRDQRRDDQRGPAPRQRRQLVAERLARPGRHHRQRMLARHHPLDHLLLHPAKVGKAEPVVENLMHAGHSCTLSPAPRAADASLAASPSPCHDGCQ